MCSYSIELVTWVSLATEKLKVSGIYQTLAILKNSQIILIESKANS